MSVGDLYDIYPCHNCDVDLWASKSTLPYILKLFFCIITISVSPELEVYRAVGVSVATWCVFILFYMYTSFANLPP